MQCYRHALREQQIILMSLTIWGKIFQVVGMALPFFRCLTTRGSSYVIQFHPTLGIPTLFFGPGAGSAKKPALSRSRSRICTIY